MKNYYKTTSLKFYYLILLLFSLTFFSSCNTKKAVIDENEKEIVRIEDRNIAKMSDDDIIMNEIFRNSYSFYERLRNTNGLYHNYLKINEDNPTGTGSIANQGMGLVSLCVAHEMNWEPNAEAMALQTLKAVAGLTPGILIPQNDKGCFVHFFDIDTGFKDTDSFSPIDTDIMLLGAMFVKKYFPSNNEIATIVDNLVASVDQSYFIGDVDKGQVALSVNEDGSGTGSWAAPYNEYMIVAWMAKNQAGDDSEAPAVKLWNNHYESTETLDKCVYVDGDNMSYPVLSINDKRFTSMFTFIFNFALVHHFSNSTEYMDAMLEAGKADKAWWNDQYFEEKNSYEWGTGAGSAYKESDHSKRAYSADRIFLEGSNDINPQRIVSPHLLAGFGAVMPTEVRSDLLQLYNDTRGQARYEILPGKELLWRYSYMDTSWRATSIEGVDFSCMIFGLASLPQFLGPNFFNTYNDVYGDPSLGLEEY